MLARRQFHAAHEARAAARPDRRMKTFAQTLDMVDDPRLIAEYEDWHRRVLPEVVRGLRAIGIRRMRIYRHGARLFMCYEAPDGFDPARDYASYAREPRVQEWERLMRRFQRPVPGAEPGSWWAPMREVFDLERSPP